MTGENNTPFARGHQTVMYLPANKAVCVERINGGEPVVAPDGKWAWGNDVRFNPSAVYLSRSAKNDAVISALLGSDAFSNPDTRDGVVVIHDRARPHEFPGLSQSRDFIGLTVFTPDYRLLKSFDEPVAYPSDDPAFSDHCGMQDPRISLIGDEFFMTYCGWNYVRPNGVHCNAMMAKSRDLLNWEKLGDVAGLERVDNKDHVLFSEPIHGRYFMLHRPMRPEDNGEHMTELAVADRPEGPYTTLGKIMDAFPEQYPMFACSKTGASDTFVCVARTRRDELVDAIERHGQPNRPPR